MTNMIDAMEKYAGKAIKAREKYYEGEREAISDFNNAVPGSPYANAGSELDARYRWEQSKLGKSLIADNRWHMMQAMMFGVMALVEKTVRIAYDVHKIRLMMEDKRNG